MGRHSAPDDDAPDVADDDEQRGGATAVAVAAAPGQAGRHARADEGAGAAGDAGGDPDDDLDEDSGAAHHDDPDGGLAAELLSAQQALAERPVRTTRPPGGSRSDLQLLRRHGDVRARVIAGVVVPFVVFTVVMALLGRLDRSYLIWIWIPLVTAGVLGGLFLDLGHRRHPADGVTAPETSPQP